MNFGVAVVVFQLILCRVKSQNHDKESTKILDLTEFDSENPPSTPVLINANNISDAKSFCIRYYVVSVKSQGIFTTPNGDFGLIIYTNQNLGFVEIHKRHYVFPLPKKKPYEYEHICFSRNVTNYIVANEGTLLYSAKFHKNFPELQKPLTDTKIMIGPTSYQSPSVEKYFMGKISELYLFSNHFTESELIAMTKSCDKITSGKKVFDWSKVTLLDFTMPNGYSIKLEPDSMQDVCSTKQRFQIAVLPFPMTIEGINIVSLKSDKIDIKK